MGLRFSAALLNFAKNFMAGQQFPDFDGYAVTPADGTDLPNGPCKAIYVTGTGNITGLLMDGSTCVITGAANTVLLGVQFQRIKATGTTATGIFALY